MKNVNDLWIGNLILKEMMEKLRYQYREVLGDQRGEEAFADAVERSTYHPSRMYDFVEHALRFGYYEDDWVPVTHNVKQED